MGKTFKKNKDFDDNFVKKQNKPKSNNKKYVAQTANINKFIREKK